MCRIGFIKKDGFSVVDVFCSQFAVWAVDKSWVLVQFRISERLAAPDVLVMFLDQGFVLTSVVLRAL